MTIPDEYLVFGRERGVATPRRGRHTSGSVTDDRVRKRQEGWERGREGDRNTYTYARIVKDGGVATVGRKYSRLWVDSVDPVSTLVVLGDDDSGGGESAPRVRIDNSSAILTVERLREIVLLFLLHSRNIRIGVIRARVLIIDTL